MKWLKHMAATWDDERIAALVDRGGMEGLAYYGLYWRVNEIIAGKMEGKTPSCSVRYSVTRWSLLLSLRGSLVFSTLSTLGVTGLVTVERDGNDIRVTNCNLLKYRDEYSKKSRHDPDSVGARTELEGEQKQIEKEQKPSPADRGREDSSESLLDVPDPAQPPVKPPKPPTKTELAKKRHTEFKEILAAYWKSLNSDVEMPWDGAEGAQLDMWLRANPNTTVAQFRGYLWNRYNSEVNHAERVSKWIRNITSFSAGPLDRFNKPLNGGTNGRPDKSDQSPTKRRVDASRRRIAEMLEARGILNLSGGGGGIDEALPEPGIRTVGSGVHSGLRETSPEILPPKSTKGS